MCIYAEQRNNNAHQRILHIYYHTVTKRSKYVTLLKKRCFPFQKWDVIKFNSQDHQNNGDTELICSNLFIHRDKFTYKKNLEKAKIKLYQDI